ncbi:MAG: PKD domain-containing protein, partial [Anaerolineae bacterium]|nr:PKD domain-containing protein [Anaerolineae bacterium]
SYQWDFGDGTTAAEVNPQHTYTAPGDYPVMLRAVGPGGENTDQASYSVAAAAQPPVAGFSVAPPTGTVGQPVQFTNPTTGDVTSYQWDFGDGEFSAEASPQHVYAAPGNYPVFLTATGPGGENTAQASYGVVPAEQPQQPSIVDQTPILPEIASQQVRNRLRTIFDSGAAQGKRAAVFTVIGGDMAVQGGYIRPFADPGLNTGAPELQSIIDWYNQIDLGDGRSSFDHASAAVSQGWRIQDLLDPGRSGGNCNSGETPLDCELRLVQPSVAVISIGLNDVGATDPGTFRATMGQVLQVLLDNGVIPVVTTIQPNPNNADAVRAINEAIIAAAQDVEAANGTVIPIYNLWRAYSQLPNNGLEGTSPTTSPSGPGILSPDAVGTYASNTRNSNVLTILDLLRSQVFPDATAG